MTSPLPGPTELANGADGVNPTSNEAVKRK